MNPSSLLDSTVSKEEGLPAVRVSSALGWASSSIAGGNGGNSTIKLDVGESSLGGGVPCVRGALGPGDGRGRMLVLLLFEAVTLRAGEASRCFLPVPLLGPGFGELLRSMLSRFWMYEAQTVTLMTTSHLSGG